MYVSLHVAAGFSFVRKVRALHVAGYVCCVLGMHAIRKDSLPHGSRLKLDVFLRIIGSTRWSGFTSER